MPPKGKAKKSKQQDDDEYWAKAGVGDGSTLGAVDGDLGGNSKDSGVSAFAALDAAQAEDEDFGGLMSTIKATSGKGKKDKKKPKKGGFGALLDEESASVSFADGPGPGEGSDTEAAAAKGDISSPKKAVQMTPDDLADEFNVPKKSKKKKGKKGAGEDFDDFGVEETPAPVQEVSKAPVEVVADDEWPDDTPAKGKKKGKKGKGAPGDNLDLPDDQAPTPTPAAPAPAKKEAPEPTETPKAEGDDEPEIKLLSKKEKEKLRKEREKAKKKAEAAEAAALAPPPPPEPTPVTAPPPTEQDADDDDGAAGGGRKNRRRKPKKEEEPAPAPAAKKKGPGGGISALKAMMEEKKRLEEEMKRREEEEKRRIEEEERLAEEEAKRKEEERLAKKEREKAKRELAKQEGRLLTKKQKEQKAAAEIRRKALMASGFIVEGLQQPAESVAPKKVVYGSRRKKAPGPVPAAETASPAPSEPISLPPTAEETAPVSVKDDWDVESDKEEPPATPDTPAPDVKDDWDASTEEEEDAKAKAPISKAPPPASKSNGTPKTAPKTETPAKAPTQATPATQKAPPAKSQSAKEDSDEDSSEESSDSEDDSDDDDSDSSDEEMTAAQRAAAQKKAIAAERRAKTHADALAARSKENLRSPICCILGHVDTGKTKLLDKIRQTNVQEGEAGGITQQIGATYFPVDAIKTKTAVLNKDNTQEYKIPGLLVIDTPGHESFTNLRSRGSSLCNIAILVVDIMHGLEPQTLESLRLLRDRKTPFIVALNKIDRLYGWTAIPDNGFRDSLAKQKASVQKEFADRLQKTIIAFAEQGLNAVPYYDNKNFARNVSLVPTSAITGEGVPDMIMLLVNLTQQRLSESLMYLSELECTVLEVKVIEGLGTTIDVVLSNGILREGDKIVVCGLNGPIVTQVRALLTPQPLRELRIKSAYVHNREVKAALGVKISAPDLEKAIAGSRLLVVGPDDDEDDLREEVMSDLTSLLDSIDKSGRGVCVQASTLGSLEALLDFLKVSKIPVSGINIGPVHKKDVMRCATVLEKQKELACILCFDVTVDKEAEKLAEELGVKLFKADIIYHLFDAFTAYNNEIQEAKRKDAAPQAIWPCRLKTITAFAKRDPIILGVDIIDGTLRVGTPLCVVKVDPVTQKKEIVDLGKITSLEINHKAMDIVKKAQAGGGVAVKIEHAVYQSAKLFGRHFDEKDEVVSHITRASIDVLKSTFKAEVSTEEWLLIKGLKPRLGIP